MLALSGLELLWLLLPVVTFAVHRITNARFDFRNETLWKRVLDVGAGDAFAARQRHEVDVVGSGDAGEQQRGEQEQAGAAHHGGNGSDFVESG